MVKNYCKHAAFNAKFCKKKIYGWLKLHQSFILLLKFSKIDFGWGSISPRHAVTNIASDIGWDKFLSINSLMTKIERPSRWTVFFRLALDPNQISSVWTRKCKKQKNNLRSSMYTTRDRQGHLWQRLTLTYKVTRQGYAVGCCLIAFFDPLNARNKKNFIDLACILPEIGKVTCNHAWPWRTRSRKKVTELVVISLHSLTHRM